MSIRAYKLAEELGIEKAEFVERARSLGIELKNPMAPVGDTEAALLRERFGERAGDVVTEARVEASSGGAVIRRRRRAAPPPPEPAPRVEVEPPKDLEPAVEPGLEAVGVAEPEPIEVGASEPAPDLGVAELKLAAPAPVRERTADAAPAAPAGRLTGAETALAADSKGKQRKRVREVVNLREQEQLARQVTGRTGQRRPVSVDPRAFQSPRRKRRELARPAAPAAAGPPRVSKRVLRVEGSVSVAELARQLGAKAAEVQGKLMAQGQLVSLSQSVDAALAGVVAAQYGFEVQDVRFREEELLGPADAERDASHLKPRPPVVTVMGHVDHGKTSLLDAIRKTKVAAGEAGGITQHIGAYQVTVGGRTITFIDTPGHEAFTAMRARGAQATDVVVLVVAANDGIMPQTVEAIDHARAAGVPILVAINKVDLPDADPQTVRRRLMEHGLVPEDFGGDTICVDVSALRGTGLDQIVEMLGLQAEILELKADPTAKARGVVLEAQLDKGRGPLATVLVQEGTLQRGDSVVVGTASGRVRAMYDDRGELVKEAGPSRPVQVIGLDAVPEAGELLHVVENERDAKQLVAHRAAEARQAPSEPRPRLTLEQALAQAQNGGPRELGVVLKADTQGSVQAVADALAKLSTDAVKVRVLHAGVGAIVESDVMLARASEAIIVGFHVRPDAAARAAADGQGVEMRLYRIIYEVVDEVRKAMAGLLPPTVREVVVGSAEVRRTFAIPKVGTVAGCFVTEGTLRRSSMLRLVRDGVNVYEGRCASLKRFKDDVREVQKDYECGIGIEGFNDVKVGDVIEAFEKETRPAEL
ncbi:MAG TPA: translation initiation factor IF-2 [Myxococcota bacterium]|nr:translation initiation factor IF-2 [Myxococcota bacterium]